MYTTYARSDVFLLRAPMNNEFTTHIPIPYYTKCVLVRIVSGPEPYLTGGEGGRREGAIAQGGKFKGKLAGGLTIFRKTYVYYNTLIIKERKHDKKKILNSKLHREHFVAYITPNAN